MCRNPFKRVEAEPLVFTRILRPPIFRRFSGVNDAAMPTAIRWVVRRITGDNSAAHPLDHPAKLTGDCREVAGKLSNSFRASRRSMSRKFPPHCQRSSADIAAAHSGHSPVTFPSYACH